MLSLLSLLGAPLERVSIALNLYRILLDISTAGKHPDGRGLPKELREVCQNEQAPVPDSGECTAWMDVNPDI